MANLCGFALHAEGTKNAIEALKKAFTWDEEKGYQAGYIYDDVDVEIEEISKNLYVLRTDGCCKWSVQSAMLDKGELQKVIQENKLTVEIYSEEYGLCFMEHFLWNNGVLEESKCVDAERYNIQDIQDELEDEGESDELDCLLSSKLAKEAGITQDNYERFADDCGDIKLGGFDWDFVVG